MSSISPTTILRTSGRARKVLLATFGTLGDILGRRAVLLAGARDAARLAKIVGPGELVREHAPHAMLFPRSAGVVHHGGVGTTAEALRAGRPQLVVPFFGDQPDHASRIERLGIGVALKLSRYDVRRATAALQAITQGDCATRAARFATAMSTERGVAAVADWVERFGGRDPAAA